MLMSGNPRGIFEHSLILVIRLGSVLYQFEQRSVEDWLDLFAANARDLLYTSFNTERCGFVALETGYQCKRHIDLHSDLVFIIHQETWLREMNLW